MKTNQKIILLKGLPASGKSSFAKELCLSDNTYKRINKDDIRIELGDEPYSKAFEKRVLLESRNRGIAYLQGGYNLVVDDTNFNKIHEDFWSDIALQHGFDFKVKFFNTPLKECIKRDSLREKPVGKNVIKRMFHQNKDLLLLKKDERNYRTQDKSLKKCIICDLDGTLALMNGRNPYDASNCQTDILNQPIADMIRQELHNGTHIIFFSGRSSEYCEQTKKWLIEHDLYFQCSLLVMRKENDFRSDEIVKKEMFDEHIKDKYFVKFVLDDRTKVVRMWRELGLLCLQVYWGDF